MKIKPYETIFEDENIIVVYKNRDVLSTYTTDIKTKYKNLYFYVKSYLKNNNEECYIVHRLDFETSGVMIFAKNKFYKIYLQKCFENQKVERYYEAVIKEKIDLNKKFKVNNIIDNKEAITIIKSINYINIGTALDINILNGRHNQIRIAVNSLGYTLLGDKRFSKSFEKRLYLNSYKLKFETSEYLKVNEFEVNPLWIKR